VEAARLAAANTSASAAASWDGDRGQGRWGFGELEIERASAGWVRAVAILDVPKTDQKGRNVEGRQRESPIFTPILPWASR
jgi:hypothetical protein